MTDELAERCKRAVHVITPEGVTLSAGRASLYVMDSIGWHTCSTVFSMRPFIWLVEAAYWIVARNRQLFSRFFFAAGGTSLSPPTASIKSSSNPPGV
jgi:hypothetical protein